MEAWSGDWPDGSGDGSAVPVVTDDAGSARVGTGRRDGPSVTVLPFICGLSLSLFLSSVTPTNRRFPFPTRYRELGNQRLSSRSSGGSGNLRELGNRLRREPIREFLKLSVLQ